MRSIERHGGAVAPGPCAFTGFAALPAPAGGKRDWWTVLGLPEHGQQASANAFNTAWRVSTTPTGAAPTARSSAPVMRRYRNKSF